MMTKRLGGLAVGVALTVACSSGAPPQGASLQGGAAATENASGDSSTQTSAGTAASTGATTSTSAGVRSAGGANERTEPATPRFKDVTIPAGTPLSLELETAVSSDKSRSEDAVRAKLSQPILIAGETVVPSGAQVTGSVLEAKGSGRVSGRASVAFRFDRLRSGDQSYDIRTARIAREAKATKKEDAKKIGIGAGAGAIVGAIAGGKKGAVIGTAIGGGAGTGVVMATKGQEVHLGPGLKVKTTLEEPLKVSVRVD